MPHAGMNSKFRVESSRTVFGMSGETNNNPKRKRGNALFNGMAAAFPRLRVVLPALRIKNRARFWTRFELTCELSRQCYAPPGLGIAMLCRISTAPLGIMHQPIHSGGRTVLRGIGPAAAKIVRIELPSSIGDEPSFSARKRVLFSLST